MHNYCKCRTTWYFKRVTGIFSTNLRLWLKSASNQPLSCEGISLIIFVILKTHSLFCVAKQESKMSSLTEQLIPNSNKKEAPAVFPNVWKHFWKLLSDSSVFTVLSALAFLCTPSELVGYWNTWQKILQHIVFLTDLNKWIKRRN